ncbi:mRNA (guanine-N(7))-methyltransferase [Malassezia vespertilionis]|uniref:mRNA (guanine-N(7))-methyltransferase n=1 Tax=Malassezia vespertilionis TaxID=2020962 RepID=UPI0024B113B9|nr:mRNA (guanine-N(7))-methyltransferase [Malassezia vespertilionis]WFD05384.1 mRNA (guanine-N(7))-methyltransferase [Malassezia vespertilionis]
MAGYDPIPDVSQTEPVQVSEAPTKPTPTAYAPAWRVSEPDTVQVPMLPEEFEELKRSSLNSMRNDSTVAQLADQEYVPQRRATRHPAPSNEQSAVVAQHYNKRGEVGREQREFSPILPLKRFNNWIKSALIHRFSTGASGESNKQNGRILDLGCGKGGDLNKWEHQHPSLLVMVDIAEVSVAQAQERYKNGKFSFQAMFFDFDCFRVPLESQLPSSILETLFDTVSLQFCLHYGWDTEKSVDTMLSNVAKALRVGGTFIGTTVDDEMLYSRLETSPMRQDSQFGNESYGVRFTSLKSRPEQPFGNQYYFWLEDAIEDVPEYVVDWKTFERKANEHGLELIYKARFDQMLADGYELRPMRLLLERMHVIDQDQAANGVVTPSMPMPLWDVCTLYVGFAFRKMESEA